MDGDDTVFSSAGRWFDDDRYDIGALVAIEILLEPRRPVAELLKFRLGVLTQIGGGHEQPEAWLRLQCLVEKRRGSRLRLQRRENEKRKRQNEKTHLPLLRWQRERQRCRRPSCRHLRDPLVMFVREPPVEIRLELDRAAFHVPRAVGALAR